MTITAQEPDHAKWLPASEKLIEQGKEIRAKSDVLRQKCVALALRSQELHQRATKQINATHSKNEPTKPTC